MSAVPGGLHQREGKLIDSSLIVRKVVQPAFKWLEIPRVGWRAFRHTVATLLQKIGAPIKIAQKQLGQASPTTTLSIYTHTVPEAQRNAVAQMADQLFWMFPSDLKSQNTLEGILVNG